MNKKTCSVDGCDNKHRAKGLCSTHYNRELAKPNGRKCSRSGCDRPHLAKGMCRSHYYKSRPTPVQSRPRELIKCYYCGGSFERPKYQRKSNRPACSTECRSNIQRPPVCELPKDHWARWFAAKSEWPRNPIRDCFICGTPFAPTAPTNVVCGDECRSDKRLYDMGKMPSRALATIERKCVTCGGGYFHARSARIECEQCRTSRRKDSWITKSRRSNLYERDGYVCHICGTPTRPGTHYLHPEHPTLDHLVPRSKGGTNEDYNLATCHRECNSRRGAEDLPILQIA